MDYYTRTQSRHPKTKYSYIRSCKLGCLLYPENSHKFTLPPFNENIVLIILIFRFGGALDGAAAQFTEAFDSGMTANDFVNKMKKEGKLIMGIGHRVKSINNPDKRVTLISDFAKQNFPNTPMLDYARQVEQITTKKKPNLILNVDGCIALCFVDLLRHRYVTVRKNFKFI